MKKLILVLITGLVLVASCGKQEESKQKGIEDYDIVISFKNLKGLKKGDPVIYEGYTIGEVKHIKALADNFLVTVKLNQEIQLYKNSKATVICTSLLGGEAIKIARGNGEKLKSEEVLIGEH